MLNQWLVLIGVIMGLQEVHSTIFKLEILIEEAEEVISCIHAQSMMQSSIPEALVRIIQIKFSKRFHQVFNNQLMV